MKEQLKKCSTCGKEKPISEFHKDSRGILGVRADCKECRSNKTRKSKEDLLPRLTSETKVCEKCGKEYKPTSNRQKHCLDCQHEIHKSSCKDYYKSTYRKKGYDQEFVKNNNYKNGIGFYQRLKKLKSKYLICERCGSDIHLLVHHKNRNRRDNTVDNLELLCKKCHQKEHTIRNKQGKFVSNK